MAKPRNQAKQARLDARAEQIKLQAARETRTRNIVIIAFAVLIVGGSGVLYFLTNPPSFLNSSSNASGGGKVGQIQTIATETAGHIGAQGSSCVEPPSWKANPPSSGCHEGTLPEWGAFDTTKNYAPRRYVHNLEHGGVVLLYKCSGADCTADLKIATQLYQSLPPVPINAGQGQASSEIKFASTPYQDMTPSVALVAWGKEEDLSSMTSADLQKSVADFYGQFAGKPGSPEALVP